jgi:hypothetical protein
MRDRESESDFTTPMSPKEWKAFDNGAGILPFKRPPKNGSLTCSGSVEKPDRTPENHQVVDDHAEEDLLVTSVFRPGSQSGT